LIENLLAALVGDVDSLSLPAWMGWSWAGPGLVAGVDRQECFTVRYICYLVL
jgi:hypothetical protein